MTRLAAIVPATNRPPTLERCLAAIRSAQDPPEELIAVEEAEGSGPAAARNDGARRATADVLVFVDSDVIPHGDAFARIRRAFAADAELVALFGAYDDAPEAPGLVSGFRNLLHHHVHAGSAGRAETFWAGLGAIRRDEFLAVGGFDARRYERPSIEDVELGMRLAATGARIELDPAVRGTHLKRWTLAEMVATDLIHRGAPWVELLLAERRGSTALNLGWRHRLSAAASLAAVGGLAARRTGVASVGALALVGLNASFYALLLRRRGPLAAAASVGLHALHHLTGAAALPVGLLRAFRSRLRAGRPAAHADAPAKLAPDMSRGQVPRHVRGPGPP